MQSLKPFKVPDDPYDSTSWDGNFETATKNAIRDKFESLSPGGTPTQITVANEATDTTCFPLFVTAATGDLGPKTNANFTFNSNTGVVTLVAPILGTITSGVATNLTGLPISSGVSGLGSGIATFLGTPSSSNLASAITDETGSGSLVFGTSPTLVTASLGSSTATTQTAGDSSTKLATTAFVANAILGQDFKEAAKYATTAALPAVVYANGSSGVGATLTGVSVGAISTDGSSPSVNDRLLVKNQVSTFQNGLYTVTATGSGIAVFVLTRTTDFNQAFEINTGDSVFVSSGSTLGTTTWAYNGVDTPVIGTDAITFAQTAGQGSFTAGNGISITGVSIAINTAVTVDLNTAQTLTNKNLSSGTNTFPVFNQLISVVANSSATYTDSATSGQKVVKHDATSADITHNLATAVGNTAVITIKKGDSSSHTITVDANSTETIDGGLTAVLRVQYTSITLISDGSNWMII